MFCESFFLLLNFFGFYLNVYFGWPTNTIKVDSDVFWRLKVTFRVIKEVAYIIFYCIFSFFLLK